MRKIIQLLYDQTSKSQRPVFLALLDDGTVWRQTWVPVSARPAEGNTLQIVDPVYVQKWERATEFDQLTNRPAYVEAGFTPP